MHAKETKAGDRFVGWGGTPSGENRLRLELRWSPAAAIVLRVGDQNDNSPRYRWPWFVLAAFLLGVVLAIAWMSFAVHRERQERDLYSPLPGAPAR
ncbi:MAG: hypothetical protein WAO02_14485 [Verrucomicrobiia bacterium]